MTKSNTYIKSPLNYVGGKFKLLPSIIPLIPTDLNVFYDLFGGGFNVGINVEAERIVYNDINEPVSRMLKAIADYEYDIFNLIYGIIDIYGLSRSDIHGYSFYNCDSNSGLSPYNKVHYEILRDDYNRDKSKSFMLYTLVLYSFNNQIRYNRDGDFNMPCGKRDFNVSQQRNLKAYCEAAHNKNIEFHSNDFRTFDLNTIPDNSFVYCDPPYLGSVATYNEQGAWTETDERDLLEMLDELNDKNVRFALSNNLKYNNPYLDSWKNKYNVRYLGTQYKNCNYHKKDKSDDIEVLITNYSNLEE